MKKRFFSIFLVISIVLASLVLPTAAEGYQTSAFVTVTTCTVRLRPEASTSADNKMASIRNGSTMTIVGESSDYYAVLPSSICDNKGVPLGLSDYDDGGQLVYGFVDKGVVKPTAKQYVVLNVYANLYCGMYSAVQVGQKPAGTEMVLLDTQIDQYGYTWYIVQMQDSAGGAGYIRSDFAYLKQDGTGATYQLPTNQQTAQLPVITQQPVVEQPVVVQTETEENLNEPDTEFPAVQPENEETGEYAIVNTYMLMVRAKPDGNSREIGYLYNGDRVQVLGEDGIFTIIKFTVNGVECQGYVYTKYLEMEALD